MPKTIIITGATGNLGKAVTQKFIAEGYTVVGTVEPGKEAEQSNSQVVYHSVDLLNAEEVEQFIAHVVKKHGTVDALACLAGGFGMSDLVSTTNADLDKMIYLNFYTAFNIVRPYLAATGHMQHSGHVLLISAKPVFEVDQSQAVFPYALSKDMVRRLAEGINADTNINARASVIAPSIIDTPPNREAMPDARFEDWVTPESIANHLAYLCSDAGADLRGTVLKVYGHS